MGPLTKEYTVQDIDFLEKNITETNEPSNRLNFYLTKMYYFVFDEFQHLYPVMTYLNKVTI